MTRKSTKIGIKVKKIGVSCNDKVDLNVAEFGKIRGVSGSNGFTLKPTITSKWAVIGPQKQPVTLPTATSQGATEGGSM